MGIDEQAVTEEAQRAITECLNTYDYEELASLINDRVDTVSERVRPEDVQEAVDVIEERKAEVASAVGAEIASSLVDGRVEMTKVERSGTAGAAVADGGLTPDQKFYLAAGFALGGNAVFLTDVPETVAGSVIGIVLIAIGFCFMLSSALDNYGEAV